MNQTRPRAPQSWRYHYISWLSWVLTSCPIQGSSALGGSIHWNQPPNICLNLLLLPVLEAWRPLAGQEQLESLCLD